MAIKNESQKDSETISDDYFALPPDGLDDSTRKIKIETLERYFTTQQEKFLGYQVNQRFDYRTEMSRFLNYHINNVGDPFEESHFTLHTRWVEKAVLDYYAKLWHAKPRKNPEKPEDPVPPDAYWGYVLTMGSSEGNNYALWNARDYLSGKTLMREPGNNGEAAQYTWVQDTPPTDNQNAFSPVCFYSHDTHYSVAKAIRVLNIPNFFEVGTTQYPYANPLAPGKPWPEEVPSAGGDDGPGSIDIDALVKLVEFFASMGHPILINLNYGSTFKCAYDDVEGICKKLREDIFPKYEWLKKRKVRYGRNPETGEELVDERTGYWIHIDGALGATYAPFLEKAITAKKFSEKDASGQEVKLPKFDFRIPEVCSIVTSGHKYPGAPWPCGIFMTKANLQMLPPKQPAVIGSPDTTFGGSRNAFSPLIMWDFLAKHSEENQIDMIIEAEKLAAYAKQELEKLNKPGTVEWSVARTPLALTVRFRQPLDDTIVRKYTLATVPLRTTNGQQQDYAHLYVMPHVTQPLIDNLVADLKKTEPKLPVSAAAVELYSYVDGVAHPDDVVRLARVRTWGTSL